MPDAKGIGRRIKSVRKDKKLSQVEFAKSIGITQQALSQIESGASQPSYEALGRITSIYCISSDKILFNKDSIEPDISKTVLIPLVEQHAVAGSGNIGFSIAKSDIKENYRIPKFDQCKVDFMVEVYGDSMIPSFKPGDIVACAIINEESFIQWNKVHLIATSEQGLILKRIRKGSSEDNLLAVSDNHEYDEFLIPKSEITGIALVAGLLRLE